MPAIKLYNDKEDSLLEELNSNAAPVVSVDKINSLLPPGVPSFSFLVHDKVDSTNTRLKALAANKAYERTVVIASSQTAGRGRMGRTFVSPDSGLYFSLLLRPRMPASDAVFITTAAAVAMCGAIDSLFECKAGIKWVNDIYIDNKKICGILTEAAFDNNGKLTAAVVGLGVNVFCPKGGFDASIADKAGALLPADADYPYAREKLIAAFLIRFWGYYRAFPVKNHTSEYAARSILTERSVVVNDFNSQYNAVVTGIDDRCCLLVRLEDGSERRLSSGEVTLLL